jgi:membrane fusion protein (multidrug efflux system)
MKVSPIPFILLGLLSLSLPACSSMHAEEKGSHEAHHEIVATSPMTKDVIITQPYVCQIHARRHIELKALEEGYLEEIKVKEGQAVKKNDVLFTIYPPVYDAKVAVAKAEAKHAEIEYEQTKSLSQGARPVVSQIQVQLDLAKFKKAEADVKLAEAEKNFTIVKAPFDGIIDRQYQQQGSLVKKDDLLTTLSDTDVMWVYFNVPEARYFEFKSRQGPSTDHSRLELVDATLELRLADGSTFKHRPIDNFVTVEGQFDNETGNIAFRADFPNPEHLLRHGQTGTILLHRAVKGAIIIPQRATFETLDQLYVWVVGDDHVAHRRPIEIAHELEDIYVLKSGLNVNDKIILEGVRQVNEGDKVEYEFHKPEEALKHQKHHAE